MVFHPNFSQVSLNRFKCTTLNRNNLRNLFIAMLKFALLETVYKASTFVILRFCKNIVEAKTTYFSARSKKENEQELKFACDVVLIELTQKVTVRFHR